MNQVYYDIKRSTVSLLPERTYHMQTIYSITGGVKERFLRNRTYMLSLSTENLLRNYYLEAGLWNKSAKPEDIHWGWESPTSMLRGHFLGHWLSAAAQIFATTGDREIKGRADYIVSELARCQQKNGGEWVFSIPEKYLHWIAKGEIVWAPQYVIHKTLMGLWDMYAYGESEQALDIIKKASNWFHHWSGQFTREQFDDILEFETGGMLEIWADLYGVTGEEKHLELLNRYDRPRLFDSLLEGKDVLTNYHANTTIPEIIGAARAWEVTGEKRWKDIVESYWKMAVVDRGYYATGGQTSGEAWSPPHMLSSRLGKTNQEHCVVYNMMRLANILLKWTGKSEYADYWERNLYNGLLAQENLSTGMVAYYLPMEAGSMKAWGHPTEDFWCCHGTLVQAQANISSCIYYEGQRGVTVSQYIPSELNWFYKDVKIGIKQIYNVSPVSHTRPQSIEVKLNIDCEKPVFFQLSLRVPWWVDGPLIASIDGEKVELDLTEGYVRIEREWQNNEINVILPKRLTYCAMPDDPDMVAFMDGPVVLAGICENETTLHTRGNSPETILVPHNEFSCSCWHAVYKTKGQEKNIRFVPLHTVVDEKYGVYFPLRED